MDVAKGPTREDAMRSFNLLWSVVLKLPTVSYGSMKTVAKWHNCMISQLYSIESQRYRLLLLKRKELYSKEVDTIGSFGSSRIRTDGGRIYDLQSRQIIGCLHYWDISA